MTALLASCVLALLLAPAAVFAAEPAEYAIRWAQGGPATTGDVIKLLKVKGKQEVNTYSIQYFQLDMTQTPSPNEVVIGRMRTRSDGKVELTYKTRADVSASPGSWVCPLDGAKDKTEMDVTVRRKDVVRKLTRSCELEAKHPLSFPESLKATPKGCVNKMTRTVIGKVKVEQWSTSRGALLEVSMPGTTSAEDLTNFRKMVAPLLQDGVIPLDRSKSEAGSEC
ncbi:hypothetical protein ACSFA8_22625 [Variovorax sp. RT4R15]|uniref:hypothetical protein n=1 Tax=Variovorax sp. RT4R15 TaxID=3443737 RepID=UPI003F481A7F